MTSISDRLRLPQGAVDLDDHPPDATPGFPGDKHDAEESLPDLAGVLADLQEKFFADGYVGGNRKLLLVLQGMDTSGKGGVLSHVVGLLDPSGVRLKSFKKPTKEELAHDFLWRIEREVPAVGEIGIFDRSHYEDVLVVRVHELVPASELERRYDAINAFEKDLVDDDTIVVKCMLHISPEEQRTRLLARLDEPDKQWKFRPGDLDERALWPAYKEAYEIALERCNTDAAPWFVVPSDRKWYRNWAIATLLREHLEALDLAWPEPGYDVAEQRARLTDGPADGPA